MNYAIFSFPTNELIDVLPLAGQPQVGHLIQYGDRRYPVARILHRVVRDGIARGKPTPDQCAVWLYVGRGKL